MKNILFLFLLFVSSFIFSQNDCKDVITVCGNSGYSDLTVSGFGTQELSGSNTCSSQENNSIWFRLHINHRMRMLLKLIMMNYRCSISYWY